MPRSPATILAVAGLSVAGIGAAAYSGQWNEHHHAIHGNQATAETSVSTRTSNLVQSRAPARAEASASARANASASASATATDEGGVDCATEATAITESNGERTIVRQARRFQGKRGGCSSAAHAPSKDIPSDTGRK